MNEPQVIIRPINGIEFAPRKASEGAAAFDCFATEDITVIPMIPTLIPLGFGIKIPKGHAGLLSIRSSTGRKTHLRLANQVGLIDSDYRGEVMALVESPVQSHVKRGDRLFQLTIVKVPPLVAVYQAGLLDDEDWLDTERGQGGFGSTDNPNNLAKE